LLLQQSLNKQQLNEQMIDIPGGKIDLARALFWDIHEKEIPKALADSPDWVIPRVFEYGELGEIFAIIELYGKAKVIEVLMNTQLKPVARAMAYVFLDIETPNREERPLFYK
jgi:hypothetical protein